MSGCYGSAARTGTRHDYVASLDDDLDTATEGESHPVRGARSGIPRKRHGASELATQCVSRRAGPMTVRGEGLPGIEVDMNAEGNWFQVRGSTTGAVLLLLSRLLLLPACPGPHASLLLPLCSGHPDSNAADSPPRQATSLSCLRPSISVAPISAYRSSIVLRLFPPLLFFIVLLTPHSHCRVASSASFQGCALLLPPPPPFSHSL